MQHHSLLWCPGAGEGAPDPDLPGVCQPPPCSSHTNRGWWSPGARVPLESLCEALGVQPGADTSRFPAPSNLQPVGPQLVVVRPYCKGGERFADKGVDDELINLPWMSRHHRRTVLFPAEPIPGPAVPGGDVPTADFGMIVPAPFLPCQDVQRMFSISSRAQVAAGHPCMNFSELANSC